MKNSKNMCKENGTKLVLQLTRVRSLKTKSGIKAGAGDGTIRTHTN